MSGDLELDRGSVELNNALSTAQAGSTVQPTVRTGPEATPPAATGHADVDAALASLASIDHLSPREQVDRYTDVHGALQETLRTIDAA